MSAEPLPGRVALTLGAFDGVHLGHLELLQRLHEEAAQSGAAPVAVTFEPHPRCVVDPSGCPPLLTSYEERVRLLESQRVSVVVIPFTPDLSSRTAAAFFDELSTSLDIAQFVAGPRFAVGRDRQGDLDFLRRYGAQHGFGVTVVPEVMIGGSPVSSSRIRAALRQGRVRKARKLLGRGYTVDGPVVRGQGRGAALGVPTANVAVAAGRCLPRPGVYATRLHLGDRWHDAATSVGYNPTFAGRELTVEAHVLDFAADLYGRSVRLAFVSRLRGERVFADAAALVEEIERDVAETRRRLAMAERE